MAINERPPRGILAAILSGLGLIGFVVVLALLEELGLAEPVILRLMIGVTVLAAILMAVAAPTMQLNAYFVASQAVGSFRNGLAMAAGIAFLAFFGMNGFDADAFGDGTALILGPAAGFLLAGLVIFPAIRRSGAISLPDYLSRRFGAAMVIRPLALVVLVGATFALLVAIFAALGAAAARAVGMSYGSAILIGCAALLATTMLGGARSLIRAQFVQFVILFVAYLFPVLLLAARQFGVPAPEFLIGPPSGPAPAGAPEVAGAVSDSSHYWALTVSLALGTAALPHLLAPGFMARDPRSARHASAWAALFVAVLFAAAPGYALFSGLTGSGIFALPEIAFMPYVATALLTAGGLAALAAAAAGVALTLANAVGHDFYFAILDRRAPHGRRLIVARLILVAITAIAAWCAIAAPTPFIPYAAAAFSFAAAGLLPALVLGAWWPRANMPGAVAGIVAGSLAALAYFLAARHANVDLSGGLALARLGPPAVAAGFFGLPIGALAMIVVSLVSVARPLRSAARSRPPAEVAEELIDETPLNWQ